MSEATALDLATRLGRAAEAGFAVGLASLLAVVWLATLAWRHGGAAHAAGRLAPAPLLAARLGVAFVVVVAAAALFAALASSLGSGRLLGRLDDAYARALRDHLAPASVAAFGVVTHLGDTATRFALGIAVALALFAARRRAEATAWIATVGGHGLLNRMLKGQFERIRPMHDEGRIAADGWSFPSGHTSGTVVAFGMLAYLALRLAPPRWHLPALLLAAALAASVGFSRIALQVHHASDVVAGFASGGLWLAVCIATVEGTAWRRRHRLGARQAD